MSSAAHPEGTMPARRSAADRNAAYDQVRSAAESGLPLLRSYCSVMGAAGGDVLRRRRSMKPFGVGRDGGEDCL